MRTTGAKRKLVLTLEEWLRIKWAVERDTIRIRMEQQSYESILKTFRKGEGTVTEDIAEAGVKRCEEEINLAKMLIDKIEMAEILPRGGKRRHERRGAYHGSQSPESARARMEQAQSRKGRPAGKERAGTPDGALRLLAGRGVFVRHGAGAAGLGDGRCGTGLRRSGGDQRCTGECAV